VNDPTISNNPSASFTPFSCRPPAQIEIFPAGGRRRLRRNGVTSRRGRGRESGKKDGENAGAPQSHPSARIFPLPRGYFSLSNSLASSLPPLPMAWGQSDREDLPLERGPSRRKEMRGNFQEEGKRESIWSPGMALAREGKKTCNTLEFPAGERGEDFFWLSFC